MTEKVIREEASIPPAYAKIGYVYKCDNRFYILAQIRPGEVCLVSLHDGNRFEDPIIVKDIMAITQEELKRIGGDTCKHIAKLTFEVEYA